MQRSLSLRSSVVPAALAAAVWGAPPLFADLPDLTVRSVTPETSSVSAGGRLSLDYVIVNQGPEDADDCRAAIYLSQDAFLDSGDVFLEEDSIPGIDAFEEEEESEQVTIPSNTVTGDYYVLIEVDYLQEVQESNESNNVTASRRITVSGSGVQASVSVRTGCSAPAPPQSLVALNRPVTGTTFLVEVGDPTQSAGLSPGSSTRVKLSRARATSSSCGVVLSGLGPQGSPGELLISLAAGQVAFTSGAVAWQGPEQPARHSLPVPADPSLAGLQLYSQAAIFDQGGDAILTDGLDLVIGTT